MRIGVDATCWTQRRGYGRHLRGLLNAACELGSAHRFVLITDFSGESPFPFPNSCEVVAVDTRRPTVQAAGADGSRSLGDMFAVGRAISAARADVLLFPTVYSWVPTWTPAPKVLMVHDVIAERLPRSVFPTAGGRLRWRLKSMLARAQANRIVTVSSYSRRTLAEQFGIDPATIGVVGEAPDAIFQPRENAELPRKLAELGANPGARIITYVGGFGPHKNVGRLLDAFAGIATERRHEDVVLVLVGDLEGDAFYSEYSDLRRRVVAAGLESRVFFSGFLDDDELVNLLNRSAFLVLASLMEGYGLPAIEAAACGLPVVVTRNSPIPELLGEGALPVDPDRAEDLRQAMVCLLEDGALRERMGNAALLAARGLSWQKAATELIQLLEECPGARAS